jgi:hypothetical protein
MAQDKVSFLDSLKAGAFGMAKGAVMLGLLGIVAGGALGAALGAASIIPGGAATAATLGAIAFGQMGTVIGTIIGGFTGVVASREVQAVDAQDVINIANISFAQGVEVGRSKKISHGAVTELQEAAGHFREKLAAEQKEQTTNLIR